MTDGPSRARTSVLLVEDDADLCELLVHTLRRDGHEIVVTRSGSELLRAMASPADEAGAARRVDAIVWDAPRPGRNGLVDVAKLRAAGRTVPIILLTTLDDPDVRADARRLGVVAMFRKPFDLDELRTAVRDVARAA